MNIAFRVKDILFSPKTAWPVIREEQTESERIAAQAARYADVAALFHAVGGAWEVAP